MRNALAVVIVAVSMGAWLLAQAPRTADVEFKAAQHKEEVEGDLPGAIKQYQAIADRFKSDRSAVARALVAMAQAYEKLGDPQSRSFYERVVREFTDQRDPATVARTRLGATDRDVVTRGDRAVWTGPKVDMFGHVSPDERFISFTDWSGFSNLSVFDLKSKTERPITGNKGWFQDDPNWGEAQWSAVSPDGQQIAYAWFAPKVSEVRIVSVADRQPRTLLSFTDAAPGVRDWSPDGKLLAIGTERQDKTKQIVVASVADKSMRVLKSTGWRGPEQLFFSRDSRYLAFDLPASDEDNVQQRDVFILAVDGSREVRAVADAADDRVAGWSPDGKYLLFSSARTGARSLWALRVADGRPQGLPELVKTDIGASLSLGVANSGALYLHKTVSSRDLKIARIDLRAGTLGQPVHFSQGLLPMPFTPQWSPDGRFLAYQVRGDEEGLAIRSVETGEVRRMRNLQYTPDPRWSPDGRSLIAGMADNKGRTGIFQIDVRSGDSTLIVYTDGGGSQPRWSPDGTKIYYVKRRPYQVDELQIRERDLRTGTERDIMSHRFLGYFEVSPDGRSLAVQTRIDPASQSTSIFVVPVAGGEPRELVRVPASATPSRTFPAIAWTPDSRELLTARKSGDQLGLWSIDVESGLSRQLKIDVSEWALGEGSGPPGGFSLSPDGRSIAFLMGKSGAEVWALENFLSVLKN